MPAPPDQFQRRTFVRLPYTDAYLKDETDREIARQIRRSFERPLIHVKISDSLVTDASLYDLKKN